MGLLSSFYVIRSKFNMSLLKKYSFVMPIIGLLIILVLWDGAVKILGIPQYLIPKPTDVILLIFDESDYFLFHTSITLLESFIGVIIALLLGFIVATIFTVIESLESMFLPIIIAAQAIPIIAIAPLIVLWLGSGIASKVAMATILCWFPMVMNTTKGLKSPGLHRISLMKVYGATHRQIFWLLRLPASVPYIIAGMRISAGLAMIGAIVAEYAGADRGLGYVITQGSYRLDTERLFAAVLCGALSGLLIVSCVSLLEKTLLSKYARKMLG